ncbi:ATP-dependent zinc metalloprotease FtsH [Sodaliphilus sp.]|uniref:ATP-dependent zinc metalloprotease FtsH n=1 Tax=Sodaliphilus sp. TaxID=2815818 RepID=UPI0038906FC9
MSEKSSNKFKFNIYWMYALVLALILGVWFFKDKGTSQEVSWSDFESWVMKGGVENIIVYPDDSRAEAILSDSLAKVVFKNYKPQKGTKASIQAQCPKNIDDKIDAWRQQGVFKGKCKYERTGTFTNILWGFGPIVLLILFWIFISRRMSSGAGGGGIFSVGKSKAKLFDKNNGTNVTFKDVAGLAEAKVEIAEIVDFLKNPQHYTKLGGKIPKGALLVGPPGTGKTLLAKAVAGEAEVPFFSMSGSDFVEMFVGVGASRVRDLFKQAKEKSPCIVFIDEIDAVGRARGKNASMHSNDERENTLNQLLTEMDGFGTNSGVIILAATNRADVLDKALMRAGRFDRQIYVELPELSDRQEIFNVHLRNVKIDGSVDVEQLARQTPGFSGADIANVCNEAALIAARRKKLAVQRKDFMDAIDRIIGGLEKKSKIITEEERRSIAIHEAGHATVSWHLKYASPLIKVTIVPRGKALGAAWYMPEERQIEPKQALLDEICSLLAGRVAEEMFLGFIDTGALNDLERATKIAYAMVTFYGMGESLPNVSFYDSTGQTYGFSKPYSEASAKSIDDEVAAIIAEQYQRARQLLEEYAKGHNELAELLLTNEVIFTEDVEHVFGKRKWASRTEEILKATEEAKKSENAESSNGDNPAEAVSNNDSEAQETPPPFTAE